MEAAIIATAGPAAHGKTALVRALSGRDAEREAAPDETAPIELGFAFHDVGGRPFGIVDLPGNERLVRGLLGDVHGIDLVLVTVAADAGVQPQTEECIDILHALAARRLFFVITKIDLVDAARVDTLRAAIADLARGTLFEAAPVFAVSSTSGAGIAELRDAVLRDTEGRPASPPAGWFRMWVDRSFVTPSGGLTVTGTTIAGTVRAGDTVALRPGKLTAEARTIQVHGETVSGARAGQRIAVRLGGLDRKHIRRGVVLTDPRVEFTTDRFDCWVELRPAARTPLPSFTRIELDIGTVETAGSIVLLGDARELAPRSGAYCQIALEREVIVANGDRFVLRPDGGSQTTGGGVVLHPFAVRHRADEAGLVDNLARLREPLLPPKLLSFLELLPELAAPIGYLAQGLNRTAEDVRRAASGVSDVLALPGIGDPQAYTSREKWRRLGDGVVDVLGRFQRTHPSEAGMEPEALRSRLRVPVPPRLLGPVVERLVAEGMVLRDDGLLRLATNRTETKSAASRTPRPTSPEDLHARVREAIAVGGFTPPDIRQLEAELRIPTARLQDVLGALAREGAVLSVTPDLYYEAEALERAKAVLLEFLAERAEITVAEYRTRLDASRRYALALLDHFDREGLTVRIGDARRLLT